MGPTACWSRTLLAPILSTDLLHILPPALLSSTLKLSLPTWPPEQSRHFILCFTQLPAWESLRIFLQEQDKAAPGRTHPSVAHSSLFINILHWQEGAASLFSSGSLQYKGEWFNLYFRGREYLGFLDISSPPQEILRQEKESWKLNHSWSEKCK